MRQKVLLVVGIYSSHGLGYESSPYGCFEWLHRLMGRNCRNFVLMVVILGAVGAALAHTFYRKQVINLEFSYPSYYLVLPKARGRVGGSLN